MQLGVWSSIVLICGLSACQSPSPAREAAASGRLQRVLSTGVLRVGLSGAQPPLNMKNKNGEIVGLDVDLIEALAEAMNVELRKIPYPFPELLPALERGDVDLVISGMTITAERNARVSFAGPYFISGKSLLTKSDQLAHARSSADLNNGERRFAALAGSTSEVFVKEVLANTELVATQDYDSAIQMVLNDEVDGLVADFPFCMVSAMRYPDAHLSTTMTPFTVEPLGIALPADDPLFVNLVQNYLSALETTGALMQFKAKWFSEGSWIEELP